MAKRMLHDDIARSRRREVNEATTDITGLRQVNIAEQRRDSSAPPRVPISGRAQRLEPPLDRPLNEPSGPPYSYGYDNLGATAAPPRYVDSSPGAGTLTRKDVADAISSARDELHKGDRFPAPSTDWPHGRRFMEAGVPGTGIFSGFISASTTGEFNPDLYGWNALRVYDQMRRTDADVAAALFAMKLPLLSVFPEIIPGETNGGGDGNLAKEIADFARECLFGGLERENPSYPNTWVSQSFEEVKENAFLMLDFGCAAHENLWRIDGGHIRPRFLAPRMPYTFYRWWTAEDGETLTGLEQLGYRRERYISTTVPARDLCVFVNRKEGSNFWGIAALRAAYAHWYIKTQLYRIDAIALERNGMGVPWIKFPPGAKKEDVSQAQAWVEEMAVSERTGIATPDGYEFSMVGLRGRVRDPINSIKHHSQEIVRSVMAMFIALGTTETGSRALANTLLDLFRQSLQHYASVFCACMNNFTIKPLVDMNYTPRNGHRPPYPKLVFPSIVVIDPIETAEVLQKLGTSQVDIVRSSMELEKAVLQKFGLPYGPARTKFAPTYTQVRIMAQPAGEETVAEIGRSQAPIEEQKPLLVPKGAQPVAPEPGAASGAVIPLTPGDNEIPVRGRGVDIHDMVNEIVAGRHGTGVIEKGTPVSQERPRRYRLSDTVDFQGIPVFIENTTGEVRRGVNQDGSERKTEMKRPYGHIQGVLGLDQEELDCFVGPYRKAKNVYIIRTRDPNSGVTDEEKVMLGFRSSSEAKNTFLEHYDDPSFFRSMKSIPLQRFKEWLASLGGQVKLADGAPEVGIDLDGTLAEIVHPFNPSVVGDPIPLAVEKVRRLRKMGYKVWIFTARANLGPVVKWSLQHGLDLPVTNHKRPQFVAIIDDRAVERDLSPADTVDAVKDLTHPFGREQ